MPVELSLCPMLYPTTSFTLLRLVTRTALWPAIEALPQEPAAPDMMAHVGEDGLFVVADKDPYGKPYRTASVRDLLTLRRHEHVQDNPTNRAIWAYLAKLNRSDRVLLHWS